MELHANNRRDSPIWSDFANVLITEARKLYIGEKLAIDFDNVMYAIDNHFALPIALPLGQVLLRYSLY